MGCCVSTKKDSKFDKVGSKSHLEFKSTHENRAPPPSLDQEETVKEVLSETPKLKPPQLPEPIKNPNNNNRGKNHQQNNRASNNVHSHAALPTPIPPLLDDEKVKIQESRPKDEKMFQEEEEEIFELEASEVDSLTLSGSLSTATINNGRMDCEDCVDQEEVQQRVMRSPPPKLAPRNRVRVSGELGPKRDRPPQLPGKSPTRRADQSPGRRNNTVRSALQSREQQTGRRGLRSDPNKRDPGESSGRRSRSPAINRSTMGRSPSAGKNNQSPGPVRTDPSPPERGGGNAIKMGRGNGMEGGNWRPNSAANSAGANTNESLENPLVSLECFIFL